MAVFIHKAGNTIVIKSNKIIQQLVKCDHYDYMKQYRKKKLKQNIAKF